MRVLQLLSYPIKNPYHGGQIRCSQIAHSLQMNGHEVRSVSVYEKNGYSEHDVDCDDFPFSSHSQYWNYEYPEVQDYFSGIFAVEDSNAHSFLLGAFKSFDPHLCIVEHPWLFDAAQKIINKSIPIIYSSHNIEYRLKEKILSLRNPKPVELIRDIGDLEKKCISESDFIITTTEQDKRDIESEQSKNPNQIFCAPNGVEKFTVQDAKVDDWRGFFEHPYIVFVGSAHPPNRDGFWEMFDQGLTFLGPKEKVVIIGGVCNIIKNHDNYRHYSLLNDSRMHLAGIKSKIDLQGIVRASAACVLPITYGEGSNLKTAEALESGNVVIATSKALQGYRDIQDAKLPHWTITDSANEFRMAIRLALDAKITARNDFLDIRKKVYWENTLSPIQEIIESLN